MIEFPNDINKYLAERLQSALPPSISALLKQASARADHYGWPIYLVGGYVRDLLLDIPDRDIDISVVGDAVEFAKTLAAQASSEVEMEVHTAFQTATLNLPGNIHLDLITARKETYPHPGSLPVVEQGSILDDMARRDFTVNALAFSITSSGTGELLDPHGGVADIQARLIRVLHSKSFVDDPTRIFRAVKLAERLQFKIDKQTLELILQAVRDGALYTVSIDRIRRELLLILEEPNADVMLASLENLGLLSSIHPDLTWPYPPGHIKPAETPELTREERRDTYLSILGAEQGSPEAAESLARWLHLPVQTIQLMRDAAHLIQIWPQIGEDTQIPSQTYNLLSGLDVNALEAYRRIQALSKDAAAWQRLNLYLDTLRHVKTVLNGDYLKNLGIPPGPAYKRVLDELLNAKLDGEVPEIADEERFVRERLGKWGLLK